jgi:alkylhydroperoxidase family enzyme
VKATKDAAWVTAALADYRTAPMSEGLRATLAFIEKLTLTPEAVTPADADAVRAAGVSDQALRDAIFACTLFCIIDRLADAFGFVPSDAKALKWIPRVLLGVGYSAGVV